jgi:hypothetical protein
MTNEQLDRVWEAINRAIDDRFGKTLVVGIPIEEKRDFAEHVVREIGAIRPGPAEGGLADALPDDGPLKGQRLRCLLRYVTPTWF